MLSRQKFRLCLFEPTAIAIAIVGKMPAKSITECFASLRVVGDNDDLWRYDATAGIDPMKTMVTIDDVVTFFRPDNELEVELTVEVPAASSSQAGELSFRFLDPIFYPSPIQNGRDVRCLESAEPPRISIPNIDIFTISDQQWLAVQLDDLYSDEQKVVSFFRALGVPADMIKSRPPDQTPFGGVAAARVGDTILALKIGTTTDAQLRMQGIQIVLGPVDIAGFGTIHLWADVAESLARDCAIGDITTLKRFVFAGHSLGGAGCNVLAAVLQATRPDLTIQVLSFGCPRPGDDRLVKALEKVATCRIETERDPVPYIAPLEDEMNPVLWGILGNERARRLTSFRSPPGRRIVFQDGTVVVGERQEPDRELVKDFILAWVAGLPGPDIAQHQMSNYRRVINLA